MSAVITSDTIKMAYAARYAWTHNQIRPAIGGPITRCDLPLAIDLCRSTVPTKYYIVFKAVAERAMLTGSIGTPKYGGLSDAFHSIVREEGSAGLFHGMTPRLMTHTPAVAISWTAYEAAKQWLASAFPVHS